MDYANYDPNALLVITNYELNVSWITEAALALLDGLSALLNE